MENETSSRPETWEDQTEGHPSLEAGSHAQTAPRSKRYDFEVPEEFHISDLLAIQLADCVRITQTLSDQASNPYLQDVERLHTIHSLESVVNASTKLTQMIDCLRNGTRYPEEVSNARAKRRKQ